jgi:excisionase family DNA binding protein
MDRKTYRVNEVAQILGIGRTTIYKLIDEGKLQRIKIGASTLITAASIEALLLPASA